MKHRVMFRWYESILYCVMIDLPSRNQPDHCVLHYKSLVSKNILKLETIGQDVDYFLSKSTNYLVRKTDESDEANQARNDYNDLMTLVVERYGNELEVVLKYDETSKLERYKWLVARDKEKD